jgi:excisionase family DNA binding protein
MARDLVPLLEVPSYRPWCSARYLRRLVQERRIAHHRVGRKVLIDLADVDELAERGRCEPPSPRGLRAVGNEKSRPQEAG